MLGKALSDELTCKWKGLVYYSHFYLGETESFQDSFEDSDTSAGAIALSFYSGFWAYSGW